MDSQPQHAPRGAAGGARSLEGMSANGPSLDGDVRSAEPEGRARRLLGVNAGYLVVAGAVLVVAASPAAGQARLPAWVVRTLGATSVAGGACVGVMSVAEDWVTVTRRVAVANLIVAAGLSGLAASRGPGLGRVSTGALAGPLAGLAYAQVRAVAARQGGVIA